MSIGFNPKNEKQMDQSLKVQQLAVRGDDYELYSRMVGTPISSSDPFLASAGNYGILAATAITNSVGTSIINGNLGESPGSTVTGSFTVSGSTDLANAAALQAKNDAQSGFTAMQTLGLAGTTIPSELGGQTLNSPVAGASAAFQFASGSAGIGLTGTGTQTLTLNGPGRFIIYTASTLTTGASAGTAVPAIALTGGALAKNVYFVVGSSATINQNVASIGAVFQGNIIAQASVTAPQSGTANGSFIALSAAVTLSNPWTITAVSTSSSSSASNINIYIREPVDHIYLGSIKVDASNTLVQFDQAHMSIVDSRLIYISSIATGNPSVITTMTPHGLNQNDIISIQNSDSTPNIDSTQYRVTPISSTTFSIPVNVTVAGTTGAVNKGDQPNNRGVIRLSGLPGSSFPANDLALVRYSVLEHL